MTTRLTPKDIIIAILIGLGELVQFLGVVLRGMWEEVHNG